MFRERRAARSMIWRRFAGTLANAVWFRVARMAACGDLRSCERSFKISSRCRLAASPSLKATSNGVTSTSCTMYPSVADNDDDRLVRRRSYTGSLAVLSAATSVARSPTAETLNGGGGPVVVSSRTRVRIGSMECLPPDVAPSRFRSSFPRGFARRIVPARSVMKSGSGQLAKTSSRMSSTSADWRCAGSADCPCRIRPPAACIAGVALARGSAFRPPRLRHAEPLATMTPIV